MNGYSLGWSRPPPESNVMRETGCQLACNIWYYRSENITKMLRDPPLQIRTLKWCICRRFRVVICCMIGTVWGNWIWAGEIELLEALRDAMWSSDARLDSKSGLIPHGFHAGHTFDIGSRSILGWIRFVLLVRYLGLVSEFRLEIPFSRCWVLEKTCAGFTFHNNLSQMGQN